MTDQSNENPLGISAQMLKWIEQQRRMLNNIPLKEMHTAAQAAQQQADALRTLSQHLQMLSSPLQETAQLVRAAQTLLQLNIIPLTVYLSQIAPLFEKEPDTQHILEHPETDLILPENRTIIIPFSPSISILEKLLRGEVQIDTLHWREFEKLVADLLDKDGYHVELGPGRDDGGKDIIAIKEIEGIGLFMSIWQAKKLKDGNKVGVSVIRELADTRQEHKASKGIIVTTTALTRGAIQRIQQDQYILGKVDGNDLREWIRRIRHS